MKKQMAYVLIIAGLISLVSGIFMLTKKEEQERLSVQSPTVIPTTDSVFSSATKEINTIKKNIDSNVKPSVQSKASQNAKTSTDNVPHVEKGSKLAKPTDAGIESKEKGDAFEGYVVDGFDEKYFDINEWRGDKYRNGRYPKSNLHPDLEISFNLHGIQDVFAVECKWRQRLMKGQLEWASADQLVRYQKFAKASNLPVFIIIGVGGTAGDPRHIYIIPLQEIQSHILESSDIKKYLKNDNRKFYWNRQEKTLS